MRRRPSARLLVVNPDDKLLLFQFVFEDGPLSGQKYWATPGGGVEEGESFKEAAKRELYEETGFSLDVGEEVARRETELQVPSGEFVSADERYFLIHTQHDDVDLSAQSSLEREVIKQHRWWSLRDLHETGETIYPEKIGDLLRDVLDQERRQK